MTDPKKALVLFSGGVDSTTVLYQLRSQGYDCVGLFVQYGQRHLNRELMAATRIATDIFLPLLRADLHDLGRLLACPLTGKGELPRDAHHEDPVQSATVVPARNLIHLSVAAGVAVANGCGAVAVGAHAGDAAIYPDCRSSFLKSAEAAMREATGADIRLLAPCLEFDKAGVVSLARALGVPLDWCWSCYEGGNVPCGRCAACLERKGAGA